MDSHVCCRCDVLKVRIMKSKYLLCGLFVGAVVVAAILLRHKEAALLSEIDEDWRYGC